MTTKHTHCEDCHHTPSCRFDGSGLQCYCKCHDVADAAPDLLAACEAARNLKASAAFSERRAVMDQLDSAIAKATGGKP